MAIGKLFKPNNPFSKKKPSLKEFFAKAEAKRLDEMFPMPKIGGVGASLGLTPGAQLPGRFGGGFGGARGRGVMDQQTSGDFQVARLSPTTGYRINMGG